MKTIYNLKCPTCFADSQVVLDDHYGPPELYCKPCLEKHRAESFLRVTAAEKAPPPRLAEDLK